MSLAIISIGTMCIAFASPGLAASMTDNDADHTLLRREVPVSHHEHNQKVERQAQWAERIERREEAHGKASAEACTRDKAHEGTSQKWEGKCMTLQQCRAACTGADCVFNWWPTKGGCRTITSGLKDKGTTTWVTIGGKKDCTSDEKGPTDCGACPDNCVSADSDSSSGGDSGSGGSSSGGSASGGSASGGAATPATTPYAVGCTPSGKAGEFNAETCCATAGADYKPILDDDGCKAAYESAKGQADVLAAVKQNPGLADGYNGEPKEAGREGPWNWDCVPNGCIVETKGRRRGGFIRFSTGTPAANKDLCGQNGGKPFMCKKGR